MEHSYGEKWDGRREEGTNEIDWTIIDSLTYENVIDSMDKTIEEIQYRVKQLKNLKSVYDTFIDEHSKQLFLDSMKEALLNLEELSMYDFDELPCAVFLALCDTDEQFTNTQNIIMCRTV